MFYKVDLDPCKVQEEDLRMAIIFHCRSVSYKRFGSAHCSYHQLEFGYESCCAVARGLVAKNVANSCYFLVASNRQMDALGLNDIGISCHE
jgi:hypothetical protein